MNLFGDSFYLEAAETAFMAQRRAAENQPVWFDVDEDGHMDVRLIDRELTAEAIRLFLAYVWAMENDEMVPELSRLYIDAAKLAVAGQPMTAVAEVVDRINERHLALLTEDVGAVMRARHNVNTFRLLRSVMELYRDAEDSFGRTVGNEPLNLDA